MIDRKNRYGRTAARVHDADGLARRPSTPVIDIHAHIIVQEAGAHAKRHIDLKRIPLAHFADTQVKEINAIQDRERTGVMTTSIDERLRDLDRMGIDIQVVAPVPGQCYYALPAEIAETAHRLANEGVAEYVSRNPDRFAGLGTVTLQEPELAVQELGTVMELGHKGVQILTNADGQELSDPKFRPFFAKAEELGAFIMMHPNGFTHGDRLKHYYLNNVIGNPLETALALHNLILSGTLARFPELKLMAVHGGGYLTGYSGRIDHAWGAREDARGAISLPPSTYLRQVYFDTVVFSYHQLEYMLRLFGPDRIMMGTDYPFDMGEYNPIGHIAGVEGMDETALEALTGGNAARVLGLDV
jgi:aminocarboxymuconate-semialdehyde decarboxylase